MRLSTASQRRVTTLSGHLVTNCWVAVLRGRQGRGWARAAGLALILAAGTGLARVQSPSGALAPDVWENPGDSDGDGLYDSFEAKYGLDLLKTDSFGDGIADEYRLAADGRMMWEVQEAELSAPPDGEGGGGCGATGMETALILGLLSAIRKRRR